MLRASLLLLIPLLIILLLYVFSHSDTAVAVYLVCLWGVFPISCALCSFFAGKQGMHPFVCTVPGILLMLLPLLMSPVPGITGAIVGLVGCVAGLTWQRQKTTKRRHGHGKK